MAITRFDIVSDTHGYLSYGLLAELEGADYIMHAGDMIHREQYMELARIAPIYMCLGNNDWSFEFKGLASAKVNVKLAGLTWQLCHYKERLETRGIDVAICGHTHRPFTEKGPRGTLIMNPGSPTYPRTQMGPTMGRIMVEDGKVLSAEIIQLPGYGDES